MEHHFKLIGVLLIVLSLVHVFFPKYFRWKEELSTISLINRQMMYVHTFFIALVVFLMGVLCLLSPIALETTTIGKTITLGLGIFWFARLVVQLFGYSSLLWLGKKPETIIHVIFTLAWMYFSSVFFYNYFN
jgi:hypothetical protein